MRFRIFYWNKLFHRLYICVSSKPLPAWLIISCWILGSTVVSVCLLFVVGISFSKSWKFLILSWNLFGRSRTSIFKIHLLIDLRKLFCIKMVDVCAPIVADLASSNACWYWFLIPSCSAIQLSIICHGE